MLRTASSNKQSPHWRKNRLEVLKELPGTGACVPRASGDEPTDTSRALRDEAGSSRERG